MARGRRKIQGSRTKLSGHVRKGNQLLPPFLDKLGGMSPTSWMDDRLPEMIWVILIRKALGQDKAILEFRRILNFIVEQPSPKALSDLSLTGISKLDSELRDSFLTHIVESPEVAEILSTLLLFESLPARDVWMKFLPGTVPNSKLLMDAVGSTLWHQSQESTDCRWFRLMGWALSGRLVIPQHLKDELVHYPNKGDQRKVRPGVRAAEISLDMAQPPDLTWPKAFWDEAWENTDCIGLVTFKNFSKVNEKVTRARVRHIVEALHLHWRSSHRTTAMNAKHDCVFGMTYFSLTILEELLTAGIDSSILGRLGLRTILEIRISLRFLLQENDEELWKKWRTYGAGQAKLNALKFDELAEIPRYIDKESLEGIVADDFWEELIPINIAGWSGLDLRKMSERCGLKSLYDQFYSWSSGYAHGMWGPIRESCYKTCVNPLHRLHRYPNQNALLDTVEDASVLVDFIIEDLDHTYPVFSERLRQYSVYLD